MIEFDYAFATDTPGSPKISKMVAADSIHGSIFAVAMRKRWPGRLCELPSHRKLKQLFFFILGGVNFLMQLQFLAPVELFFKQLKGYSF